MSKLDRSKPFGEVFGGGEKHRYEQDGKLFDHEGEELEDAKAPKGEAEKPAPKGKDAKAPKGEDQVEQQLAG